MACGVTMPKVQPHPRGEDPMRLGEFSGDSSSSLSTRLYLISMLETMTRRTRNYSSWWNSELKYPLEYGTLRVLGVSNIIRLPRCPSRREFAALLLLGNRIIRSPQVDYCIHHS